jgi:hypothetical protein
MRVMARPDVRPHRPAIEIADILRRHGDAYRRDHAGHLGRVERRVMSAIVACRTEALGGHVEACNDCGMTRIAYNSCRNRHCPKCQGRARAAWLAAREADLLPVPGGGLSPDGTRWIASRPNFFLAVKPLSRLFRWLFLKRLIAAFNAGALRFFGDLASLAELDAFAGRIKAMQRVNWVVYAKRPFGGPAQVLAYLGRYTHRVAIANSRLVALDDDHVAFSWKDYRQNSATKIMNLKSDEFIRRFLLHTLPDGFHRIRHFGFMANRHRAAKLALCRELLDHERTAPNDGQPPPVDSEAQTWAEVPACPDCGGVMRIIERFRHSFRRSSPRTSPFRCDTS